MKAKKAEEKRIKAEKVEALSIRVGKIFHRKPATPWADKEKKALAKLFPMSEESLELIERFYALPETSFPTDRSGKREDYRRRDLYTLLNNWAGEMDRANKHFGPQAATAPAKASDETAKLKAFYADPRYAFYLTGPAPQSRAAMREYTRDEFDSFCRERGL